MKKIFTIAILALSINAFAQVPTNGLVGYWPFNGNANDLSGSGNNGTVNGATLATDRFGIANKAYNFNGSSTIDITSLNLNSDYSISFWVNNLSPNAFDIQYPIGLGCTSLSPGGTPGFGFIGSNVNTICTQSPLNKMFLFDGSSACGTNIWLNTWQTQVWYNVVINKSGTLYTIFVNGTQSASNNLADFAITSLILGKRCNLNASFIGKLDDIGIWNRVLTQQEISALYTECDLSVQITPTDNNLVSNGNAHFVVSSNEPTATYQWQTNPENVGWQNVPSNSTYTGGATNTLNVNNVQLSNHLQPFRVIATAGTCKDTSVTARIVISDTCILTVTDTLVINATLTGLQAPNNKNTIKVYPNPANDHITIDYGNYANMSGYTLKITNTLGATVFTTTINQQTSYVDLNGWSGNGIYFVHLIDAQSNTLDIRKIVIQ